jgi:hypothetical protein
MMTSLKLLFGAGAGALGLALAGAAFADTPAAPAPTPMANPAMAGPITANPHPATFDGGPIGTITVDGVLTGGAIFQTNSAHNGFGALNDDAAGALTNAQVIINGSEGAFSFYIQAGAYNFPSLGTPYYKTGEITENTFGYVPQGFIKYQFNPDWSIEGGALPTLIGAEYTYSFQNMNIERGLLWNQEPAVSKGVQVNYAHGPLAISAALTDGYYSGVYTSLSGLITYTFPNTDALAFAAQGNAGVASVATFATAEQQNNGQIYNLIYTHNMGPLTISPYFQYNSSPNIPGVSLPGDVWGLAVLGKYQFNPLWSLAGRFEYTSSSGPANLLGYGVGSNAWSLTLTPTYQKGIFFARGEFSYTGISSATPGLEFGAAGVNDTQIRFLGELGLAF